MSMCSLTDVLVQQERYKDMQREMERYRLVRQVLAGRERRNRFHHRALTWLGQRLVAWGRHLQEQHGAPAATPTLQVADHAC